VACPLGVYIRPNYGFTWDPTVAPSQDGMFNSSTDPVYPEIFGQAPTAGQTGQQSMLAQPGIVHAFFSWSGVIGPYTSGNPPLNGDGSIKTSTARLVTYDDSPNFNTQNAVIPYWDYQTSSMQTFTNRTDSTGTGGTNGNPNNLGPKRLVDYVGDQCPGSIVLITWRCGAVDNTNNMENASSWQTEFTPANVVTGVFDSFIKCNGFQIAGTLHTRPSVVLNMRLSQEMNGNNYGWAYNNQFHNPTAPDNGPMLLNCFNQSATTGTGIATSGGSSGVGGYGQFAYYHRYVYGMLKQSIVSTLINYYGLTSTAAKALCGSNFKTISCVGSGSSFPSVGGAPLDGNQPGPDRNVPFPQISDTYSGTSIDMTSAVVTKAGGVATVTFASGAFPQSGSNAGPIGHGFPVGSTVTFAAGSGALAGATPTLTAITNTSITFPSAVSAYTASGGNCSLQASAHIQAVAPWLSFWAGDDAEPVTGLLYVDYPGPDGYQAQHVGTGWKSINSIFSSAYTALSFTQSGSPAMQVSEVACIENPVNGGNILTTVPSTWTTGQSWSYLDNCAYLGNIYQCTNTNGLTNNTVDPVTDAGANWTLQFAGVNDGAITGHASLSSQLVTVFGTSLVGMQIVGAGQPQYTFVSAVNTTTNVATLVCNSGQTILNGNNQFLSAIPATFNDGSIVVTGGGTTVKVSSAALYPLSTIGTSLDSWVVTGGGLAYNYVSSVTAGVATLVFPNGGGPTTNGTTNGIYMTVTPPTKADWLNVNWNDNSSQSWGNIFPLITAGVVYFDHDSVKTGTGVQFVGTYNVRDTASAFAAWQALATDTWLTTARALPAYPSNNANTLAWG
jgi:hypothetical protein